MSQTITAYFYGIFAAVGALWVWVNICFPYQRGPRAAPPDEIED